MAPSIKYINIALRVATDYHIDLSKIFSKDLVFALSCMETSKKGVVHTHSAITLTKPICRTTIESRLKKHYPAINGNETYSMKEWDLLEVYIDYITKALVLVEGKAVRGNESGTYQMWGEKLDLKPLEVHQQQYFDRASSRKAAIKKTTSNVVDAVVKKLSATYACTEELPYSIILGAIFDYYKIDCEGAINGNNFHILGYARKIKFLLSKDLQGFKENWITDLMRLL